jgi:hypothetical protein
MSAPHGVSLSAPIRRSLDRWLHLWTVPELKAKSRIEWSSRLTRSLGRAFPEKRLIRIASFLSTADEPLLEEILCHEMAHLATRELYGLKSRPHGPEWKALMVKAGFEPRTRLPSPMARGLLLGGAAAVLSTSTAARFVRSLERREGSFGGAAVRLAWHPGSKGVFSSVGASRERSFLSVLCARLGARSLPGSSRARALGCVSGE